MRVVAGNDCDASVGWTSAGVGSRVKAVQTRCLRVAPAVWRTRAGWRNVSAGPLPYCHGPSARHGGVCRWQAEGAPAGPLSVNVLRACELSTEQVEKPVDKLLDKYARALPVGACAYCARNFGKRVLLSGKNGMISGSGRARGDRRDGGGSESSFQVIGSVCCCRRRSTNRGRAGEEIKRAREEVLVRTWWPPRASDRYGISSPLLPVCAMGRLPMGAGLSCASGALQRRACARHRFAQAFMLAPLGDAGEELQSHGLPTEGQWGGQHDASQMLEHVEGIHDPGLRQHQREHAAVQPCQCIRAPDMLQQR